MGVRPKGTYITLVEGQSGGRTDGHWLTVAFVWVRVIIINNEEQVAWIYGIASKCI